MYDPSTVAHEIRLPWPGRIYGLPIITVWHEDPEKSGRGNRGDDSCGWFRPPTTKEERATIEKLALRQYTSIFERQCAEREGKDYASVCFVPTAYDAVYWSWRAIKFSKAKGWQYGDRRNALTPEELQAIYLLSANPMDNIRSTVAAIKSADNFVDFFQIVYSCFTRHHRPWWQHPRWHLHHWRLQIHLWQAFRRWALSRCCKCGGRFGWGESPCSSSWDSPKLKLMKGEQGVYHMRCANHGAPSAPARTAPNASGAAAVKTVH